MKKLLVTVISTLCFPLMAQVLQPLGIGLPLPEQISSGERVVASYAAGNEYLALFNEPSTPDTTDYTVGRWNGTYWSYFPGLTIPNPVKSNAGSRYHFTSVVLFHDTMYVGAYIESVTDLLSNVNHLYRYTNGAWSPVLNGIQTVNYGIRAMTVFDNKLVVAGRFSNNLQNNLVDNLAAYNGSGWSYVGKSTSEQGTDGEIQAMVADGNRLYIAGTFQKFAGINTGNIAFYTENNTTWGGIGSPFTGEVNELASFSGKLAALGTDNNANIEIRTFKSGWSAPISFADFSLSEPVTIAGAKSYLIIGGKFIYNGNGSNILRYENDSLFITGNKITGNFKLGQRGTEAFIWGSFYEQNSGIRYISKIEVEYGEVSGFLYFDKDQNCIKGAGDVGLSKVLVKFENENQRTFFSTTQSDGKFAVALPEGNYNISVFPGKHWFNNCPSNYAVKVRQGLYSWVSLGQYMTPNTQDLELHLGAATPGNIAAGDEIKYIIRMSNTGNTVLNGPTVHFTHPERLSGFTSNPPADNYDADRNEATYTLLDLMPGEIRVVEVFLKLPADATTTDTFPCFIKAGSLFTTNDAWKADNFDTLRLGLQSGFDKSVNKSGSNGDLVDVKVTRLDYMVKFTNISNTLVNRVVLLDTLDQNIKLKYMMVYDMYPLGEWNIVNSGNRDILVAEYPKANLAALESNPNSSSGYIKYYLQLATPLQHNDQVHNRANCDFDSKWKGISNMVTVTMNNPSIGVKVITGNISAIYPNPATEVVRIQFVKDYNGVVEILDATGRLVISQFVSGQSAVLPLLNLRNGLYTLRTTEGSASLMVARK